MSSDQSPDWSSLGAYRRWLLEASDEELLEEEMRALLSDPTTRARIARGMAEEFDHGGQGFNEPRDALVATLTWARVAARRDQYQPELTDVPLPLDVWRSAGGQRVLGNALALEPLGRPEAVEGVRATLDVDPDLFRGTLVLVGPDGGRYAMTLDEDERVLRARLPASALTRKQDAASALDPPSYEVSLVIEYEEP